MPLPGSFVPLAALAACSPLLFAATGCAFLLPRGLERTEAVWKTFEEARLAFDSIVPGESTAEDLKRLGYDPHASKNVAELDYLSLVAALMPGSVLEPEDVPEGLRRCIEAQDTCRAYRAHVEIRNSRRLGFWLLDLLRFRRQEEVKGFSFTGTAVLADGLVVYKTWSGTPEIYQYSDQIQPLGPLQDPSGLLLGLVVP